MSLFRPVVLIVGVILMILSVLMLLPVLLTVFGDHANRDAFALAAACTFVPAAIMVTTCKGPIHRLRSSQLYLTTVSCWLAASAFASLPLILADLPLSTTDAVFEAVSGITTTGSTVLSGLDSLSPDLVLWRSLMQWLGGIGIIGMAVAILPFIGVGGMRLFKTESSDLSDKITPRAKQFAALLVISYVALTVLCCISYAASGMNGFEALNHAMTTVSTGGYSPHDASLGYYESLYVRWTAIVFMFLGAVPFMVYVRCWIEKRPTAFNDIQVRGLLKLLLTVSMALALYVAFTDGGSFWERFTTTAFNVTSIVTTTGYATTDYQLWGSVSVALFFFLTFVGGCSGSTSGAMKIFRFQLSLIFLREQVIRQLHPRAVLTRKYDGRPVSDDIMGSAVAFAFVFFVSLALVTVALAALGLDLTTSLSGAATALCNVGPGLGEIIGPAGNFAPLPDPAKWILCIAMILGRLELLSVIIVFTKAFWTA